VICATSGMFPFETQTGETLRMSSSSYAFIESFSMFFGPDAPLPSHLFRDECFWITTRPLLRSI
jgi:hypothetical protein